MEQSALNRTAELNAYVKERAALLKEEGMRVWVRCVESVIQIDQIMELTFPSKINKPFNAKESSHSNHFLFLNCFSPKNVHGFW